METSALASDECRRHSTAMAARMWAALTSSPIIDDAAQLLLAEFEVDEKTLRADIEQFVDDLTDRGLVEFVDK